jgi:hypothetical protein
MQHSRRAMSKHFDLSKALLLPAVHSFVRSAESSRYATQNMPWYGAKQLHPLQQGRQLF